MNKLRNIDGLLRIQDRATGSPHGGGGGGQLGRCTEQTQNNPPPLPPLSPPGDLRLGEGRGHRGCLFVCLWLVGWFVCLRLWGFCLVSLIVCLFVFWFLCVFVCFLVSLFEFVWILFGFFDCVFVCCLNLYVLFGFFACVCFFFLLLGMEFPYISNDEFLNACLGKRKRLN